ncbi:MULTISPECIES: terminase [Actinomadura]|uniref:Terminase n=1 Tax=Actinomadura yumaensis TaxID=111807 RepID=A0ABW2CU23_9ACTN|nr:terminase [Actinomadura sp. J1-007]MWK39582.1 terminase [Actinomadura sp. J1-007]
MPWRGPQYPGELPTLGWYVLDWMEEYLVVPDGPAEGEPLVLTREQAQFVLQLYVVDPRFTGPAIQGRALVNARRVRRAILSRPKGWGKSPLLAALCLVEMLGDVVLDGWDSDGEPVGRPWSSLGFKAKTQVVATSEAQTKYTWEPLLEMAGGEDLVNEYDVVPMETFVAVPRGRAEYVTSSATTQEGFRPVFSVLDQTESWTPTVRGPTLAAAIRRNLGKVNGCSVEAPNSFTPGAKSVAESSFKAAKARTRSRDSGILLDHREAPPDTDPADPESLLAGLAFAYGDSADRAGGWVNLRRLVAEYWDPDTDPQDARQYYLNQVTHSADAWLSQPEVAAIAAPGTVVADGERITLGFDGSRKRDRSVTDATALVGCRLSDGHLFEIAIWEQPLGPEGATWQVPVVEVLAAVDSAFERWDVVGFFADPAKWEGHVTDWEAKYGPRLQVKSMRDHPIEWWMTGGRSVKIVRATLRLHTAIVDREITFCGSHLLTKHLIQARRRESAQGIQIAKAHPTSPDKIDGVIAAILATEARAEAVARGLLEDESLGGYTF